MLDGGDAGHLDGAGAAPVAEPGGTRRGPAAQQADREARQETVASTGRIDLVRRKGGDALLQRGRQDGAPARPIGEQYGAGAAQPGNVEHECFVPPDLRRVAPVSRATPAWAASEPPCPPDPRRGRNLALLKPQREVWALTSHRPLRVASERRMSPVRTEEPGTCDRCLQSARQLSRARPWRV